MTELPHGWSEVRTDEAGVLDLGRQRSPKYHNGPNMKPYLRVANVFEDRIDSSDVKTMHFEPEAFERSKLHYGDVLLNEGQSPEWLGRPAIYRGDPPDIAFTNSLIRFRPHPAVMSEWALTVFRHHMHSGRFARESRITTNIAHLSANRLAAVEFRVPPLREQERIVTGIEEAFSKLDAGEAGLRTVRERLKRMRDAVLACAVTGRLVSQDSSDTPAVVVLADLGAQTLDPEELGVLPDGWAWAWLDSLNDPTRPICYGILKPGPNTAYGVPYVEVRSLKAGQIDPASLPRSPPEVEKAFVRSRLRPGDLTIAIRGTTGRVAIVPPALAGGNVSRDCARLALVGMDPHFGQIYLRGPVAQRFFSDRVRGVAVKGINIGDLRKLPVAVPPIEEQRRIVAEAERQFSFIEACERGVDVGLERSAALRRSVLKAAFEGQLVPQDPSDEPASTLLERIRVEREQAVSGKPRNTRRVRSAS